MDPRRLLALLGLLVVLASALPAAAHTQVRRSTPGPAERVDGPVDEVVLEFLDPVLPTPSIEVTTAEGEPVPGLAAVQLEGDDLARVGFAPIVEPGDYRVDYSFVAVDGDEQVSAYTFTVEEDAGGVAVRPLLAGVVGAVLLALVAGALLARRRRT